MRADEQKRRAYLGRELARWRTKRKLSYRALAELMPYSHAQLWKVVRGEANMTRQFAVACDRALNTGGALVAALKKANEGYVPPAQLPIAPRLVGRDAELAALHASGRARPAGMPRVLAIDGPAGVGKTALALRWAHDIADAYVDGQLYADLRAFAPPGERVSAAEVLKRFLAALGEKSIPASTAERATLYRSLVADRKVLVVLDNVAEVGDIEALLPASADCTVVVTSRRNLSRLVTRVAASRITVRPLAERAAIALLNWVIGPARARVEAPAVAAAARLCGYLPLALHMVAELIATSPHRPVADLVTGLLEDDNRLGELRAVFSWSYRHLDAEAARVFRLLGLHCGSHLSVAAIAALANLRRARVHALLMHLASVHLIDLDRDDVVRMHDVVRVYARELATAEDPDTYRTAAVQRLADWYAASLRAARRHLSPGLPVELSGHSAAGWLARSDRAQAQAWCETETTNLRVAIALAREYGLLETAEELAAMLTDTGMVELDAGNPGGTVDCALRTTVPSPRRYRGIQGEADHPQPSRMGVGG